MEGKEPGAAEALSPEEVRKLAVAAFYDAKTDAERKAAAVKYPVLREIFSASYFD